MTDFTNSELVKQAVLEHVRANDGCSSDDVVATLGSRLAQRKAIHEAINELIKGGPLTGHLDHTHIPQSPEDTWDLRYEHLTVIEEQARRGGVDTR